MATVVPGGHPAMLNTAPPTGPCLKRRLFITDKSGVEHEIRTQQDLRAILAQMTPEELAIWKDNYRFAKVENLTKNINYTGTGWDAGF